MRNIITSFLVGLACLFIGLVVGAWQADQLKTSRTGQWITTQVSKLSLSKGDGKDEDSQFETNEYPTIKWKPKALSDNPDGVVRLWTTFDIGPKTAPQGTMKYRLTLFKATNKDNREVQILDAMGFKLMQFNANDFHNIPGAPDIVEARDSVPCSEDQYKKAHDYSVK